MKLTGIKSLVFFLFLLMTVVSVRADVIVDNLNQPTQNYFGPIGSDSNSNDFLIGQEFALPAGPNPFQLNDVALLLNPIGGGANITVSIWSVGPDNNPSNEIATVASHFVGNAGNVEFIPVTNITLSPGFYYVVAAPTTPADSGWVSWAYAASTNWAGPGILDNIADTIPGAWENYSITNLPQQMSVQATPIPTTLGLSQQGGVTRLSWPSDLNGYVVDSATNLASPRWQAITNMPMPVAGANILTNKWSEPTRFFRLRQSLVVDNLEQTAADWDGPIGTDNNSNDFLIGQEFTLPAGNYALNKITLSLIPAYGSGSVTASIWSAGPDNNPGNEIAVVSSQFVANAGNVDFIPSVSITLPSGTYYVMAAPTTAADNAKVGWYWTTSTVWTGFGTLDGYAGTYFGLWENEPISEGPYQMSVQATPLLP
jgi:hypothetical protein